MFHDHSFVVILHHPKSKSPRLDGGILTPPYHSTGGTTLYSFNKSTGWPGGLC